MHLRDFVNPGKRTRPTAIWAWNDVMEPGDIENRVRELKRAGFGGFVIQPRQGLRTEYLGDEWMRAVRRAVEIARDADMECWFADEVSGPSGSGGGAVTTGTDEHLARMMVWYESAKTAGPELLERATAFTIIGEDDATMTVTDTPESPDEAGIFVVERHLRGAGMFAGQAYPDLMNTDAAGVFRDAVHEKYSKLFLHDFGDNMPGIVTDGATIHRNAGWIDDDNRREFAIPWTPGFAEYFKQIHDYSPLDKLHLLLSDDDAGMSFRRDLHVTLEERFLDTFTIPASDWCREHELKFCGAVGSAETLAETVRSCGSAMAHMEYVDVPVAPIGVPHTASVRQTLRAASVAAQLGRDRVAGVIFTGGDHGITFSQMRTQADRAAALGITSFRPHVMPHTMRGERKRDSIPAISVHQSHWEQERVVADYLGRLSWALCRGTGTADILVLEPLDAVREVLGMGTVGDSQAADIERSYDALTDELTASHLPFDLGDDRILRRHGSVDGAVLTVGDASYRAVVMPYAANWPSSTIDLLSAFTGPVFVLGDPPKRSDGRSDNRVTEFLALKNVTALPNEPDRAAKTLAKTVDRAVSVTGPDGAEARDIMVRHRIDGGAHVVFMVNTADEERAVTVGLAARGGIVELDSLSGRAFRYAARYADDHTIIETTIPALDSRLFLADQSQTLADVNVLPEEREEVLIIDGPYSVTRNDDNTLVLDQCTLEIDGRSVLKNAPVWKAREAAWERTGIMGYSSWQPWALDRKNVRTQTNTTVLTWTFTVTQIPETVRLAMETSDRFVVTLNGVTLDPAYGRWHLDKKITVLEVGKNLLEGTNTIVATTDFLWDTDIEPLLLYGDFAVGSESDGFPVIAEPETLVTGTWTEQGYPFYTGSMTYKLGFDIEPDAGDRYELDLSGSHATTMFVKVNGSDIGATPFPPYRADITGALISGTNEVEIEVFGSLRNIVGPLHTRQDDGSPLTPDSFADGESWTDEYILEPYGFHTPPKLIRIMTG
jgi:hypothetical protein